MQWHLKNLHCQVGQRILLNQLSVEFNFNTPLAIVGTSGAGKSIGIQCALGLFPFQEGEISFHSQGETLTLNPSASSNDWSRLRSQIMFVPQFPNLFDDFTVKANLLFPFRKRVEAQKVAQSALFQNVMERLELSPLLHSYPGTLTPGQRKQVAIARAMMQEPKVLVLDEPTADLDPTAKKRMTSVLQTISTPQTSLLIITHDIQLLETLQAHLKVIDQGQISWEGDWSRRGQAPAAVQEMLLF